MAMAGNTRVTGKEQYYTPETTANMVIDNLLARYPHLVERPWLEPAGGTGSFIDALHQRGITNVVSYDIEPHHSVVQHGNFLEQKISGIQFVSIGNPPFGRNNALSVPFFNKCAEHSDVICFIVPRSWRKWSVTNRLHRNFHLVDDYDLQINYVDVDGTTISDNSHLRTCVQTWQKSHETREIVRVTDHGFIAKCSPQDADVALTIFGFSCGTLRTDFPRVPNTTQMFLKLCDPRSLDALQSVDYSRFFNHTAYTQALSLQEINFLLNEYILGDGGIIRLQK
jgi:predicted RNA methylase